MKSPRILSTGLYLPSRKVTNEELSRTLDTSDEWIYSHTGIRSRHIAAPEEASSDLAVHACLQALENGGVSASDIDLILVATSTPDYPGFPSTASLVQERIGAHKAGAMDLYAACTGYVYALETARAFYLAGTSRYILVVGAEVFSRILDWKDRKTCVLFGDGAGAVLLGPGSTDWPEAEFYPGVLRSEGSGADSLIRLAGGSRKPVPDPHAESQAYVSMDGRKVYTFAIRVIPEVIEAVLAENRLTLDAVRWFVPHQANSRIIESAAKRLDVSIDRFYLNIDRYANTSGATIPIALAEMNEQKLLKRGDLVCTIGFGAGLTYGANLFRW